MTRRCRRVPLGPATNRDFALDELRLNLRYNTARYEKLARFFIADM